MHYHWQENTLLLHCLIQPRASTNEIAGVHDGRLKVRLTASPVDGQANLALLQAVGKWFGVSKSQVQIVRGSTGRQKTLLILQPSKLPDEADVKK